MTDEELIPAATVLLLRDADPGLEVLMLRRNSKIAFGGMWVFPGGAVDDHEHRPDDSLGSARVAAVREVEEETGLRVHQSELVTWSFWVPPLRSQVVPKPDTKFRRFATWFFAATAPSGEVAVDGGEIHEHLWLTPEEAMAKRQAGEIEIVPPTWVTLWQLSQHQSVAAALDHATRREPDEFRTKPIAKEPTTLAWAGDHAYDDTAPDDTAPDDGRRHRLVMHPEGWVYDRTGHTD